MKIIKHIHLDEWRKSEIKTYREACRIVIFDKDNLMPLLYVSKDNYHKLPWWWIEWSEEKIEALKRECLEETWCTIEVTDEIWIIIEENPAWEQKNYCYIWKILSKWEVNFTEDEINNWFCLKWVSLKESIELIKNDNPINYSWKRIKIRDSLILEQADIIIKSI